MEKISIVLTIHNKDWLVTKVLESIKNNTKNLFELIIVLDGCTDKSEEVVNSFIKKNLNITIKIIYTNDVFETKANNAGMKISQSDYIIIMQDDMVINEIDWDVRLMKPILNFNDVFAVTARSAHDNIWTGCQKKYEDRIYSNEQLIDHINFADKQNLDRETFGIRDSINRGPICFRHDILKELNYLDEIYSPYTWDDHDLSYRAFKEKGMLVGSYWIDYISDLNWGTTRNKNHNIFNIAIQKNQDIIFERHKDLIIGEKHSENRILK